MNQIIALKLPGIEQGLRYGISYWTGTLGNLLTTHRLKTAHTRRYTANVDISNRLHELWHRLFDVKPEGTTAVPFLYNQSVGTLLYTRVFADLGINFRHLLHVKHETSHVAGVPQYASARQQRLDCGVKQLSRLGEDKALVDVETRIHGACDTLLSVIQDRFLIRKLPVRDLASLRRDPTAVREMLALRRCASALTPQTEGIRHCSMPVPQDMGRLYGQVSGDMNPVHTTKFGARLFGVPRPFLQGLGVRNLAIRHMATMGVPLDHLSLTFASPAYLGQTLRLLFRDGRFEVQDSRQQIVAYGTASASVPSTIE